MTATPPTHADSAPAHPYRVDASFVAPNKSRRALPGAEECARQIVQETQRLVGVSTNLNPSVGLALELAADLARQGLKDASGDGGGDPTPRIHIVKFLCETAVNERLRDCLSYACLTAYPIRTVDRLCVETRVSRSTLERLWRASGARKPFAAVIHLILLLRFAEMRGSIGGRATILRVDERTLRAYAERHVGQSLQAIAADPTEILRVLTGAVSSHC